MGKALKRESPTHDSAQAPPSAKRKKVNHACVYCRRSHMTCDSGRPCFRCTKRNIGHLCHDEPKEVKAKSPPNRLATTEVSLEATKQPLVLADTLETKHTMKPPSGPATYTTTAIAPVQISRATDQQNGEYDAANRPAAAPSPEHIDATPAATSSVPENNNNLLSEYSGYYDTSLFGLPPDAYSQFASEHTNSEFLVLSDFLSIIGDPNGSTMPTDPSMDTIQSDLIASQGTMELKEEQLTPEQQLLLQATTAKYTHHASLPQSRVASNNPSRAPSRRPSISHPPRSGESPKQTPVIDSRTAQEKFFLTAADPQLESPEDRLKSVINAKVEAGLMKPFNYVRGYARLQKFMDQNMSAASRSRILAPLSTFRPAFRAIAKKLTDVDLILVEEAFERLLLDYDRVFTSMAVPACLWRRTGEIFRGNKEFAALLDLPAESLRDGKLAITELMAEDSAVNYWEKYGDIAFNGQQKAVLTSCLLQVPGDQKGAVVSCCFSFTIKRDRYNIPSCIVGNFIPISF